MNWNNNDTKYILKRIITYFLISAMIFFIGQRCAKANVVSHNIGSNPIITIPNGDYENFYTLNGSTGIFTYQLEGVINFTVATVSNSTIVNHLRQIDLYIGPSGQSGVSSIYTCDIGSLMTYYDTNKEIVVHSVKCPIKIESGKSLKQINFKRTGNNGEVYLYLSNIFTITTTSSDQQAIESQTSSITNSYYQNSQNEIASATQNAQAIISEISNSNAQLSSDISSNTQAINDLTDTINAPFNTTTGNDYLTTFDNLFTQQDENVIRQFVMIPFNLYILLYNSITNGSCQSISLGSLYGVNLELPCINYRNIIGVPLYTTIDTIFGACLLFGIVRMIKKFFNSLFSVSSKATDENGIEVFK